MKTIFMLLILCLCACSGPDSDNTVDALYVLPDLTDTLTQVQQLRAEPIKKMLPIFSGETHHGVFLKFMPITGQRLNPDIVISITSESLLGSNELDRKTAMAKLEGRIDTSVSYYNKLKKGREKSQVIYTVGSAITELSSMKSNGLKRLVILSDCKENSVFFDAYSGAGHLALKQRPDTIEQLFNAVCPLPQSLKGLEIIIVHQPSQSDDENFYYLSQGLKHCFSKRGAEVKIQSNL